MSRFASLAAVVCLLGMIPDARGQTLRAGAVAMDVTPTKYPISVNGGMRDVIATAAHDPLHARCLVLDDGKTQLAIVVVDSCMLPRELVEDAKTRATKRTGIPADRMLISATHTHSAPTVAGVFQSEPDPDYVQFLAAKIAIGIQTAQDRLARPASVSGGSRMRSRCSTAAGSASTPSSRPTRSGTPPTRSR